MKPLGALSLRGLGCPGCGPALCPTVVPCPCPQRLWFLPSPPSLVFLAFPSIQRIIFQTAPVLCPAVRLFSLVLVTLSDCSRISSQVSLFSAITTLLFFFLNKYIPLSLSLSEGLKVVLFSFLCAEICSEQHWDLHSFAVVLEGHRATFPY